MVIMSEINLQQDITECVKVLHNGGLILYPTDTIWGIGCDATNANAVKKIFDLKKRAETKSLIVLVAEDRDVLKYTSHPDLNVFVYLKNVQKPTTVIYEGAIGLAENIIDTDGNVAIRIVKEIFCKQLIKQFRKPIVSTSANISGEASPQNFDEISNQIKNGVDYLVNYRREDKTKHQPSSIIKFSKNGTVEIIRP